MKKRFNLKGVLVGAIAMFAFIPAVFAEEIKEINLTVEPPKAGDKVKYLEKTCKALRPAYHDTITDQDVPAGETTYNCNSISPEPKITVETKGIEQQAFNDGTKYAMWTKIMPSQLTVSYPNRDDYETDEEFNQAYNIYNNEMYHQIHYTKDELNAITFEAGKDYILEILLFATDASSTIAEDVVVKVNGKTTDVEIIGAEGDSPDTTVYVKLTAVKQENKVDEEETKKVDEENKLTYKTLDGAKQEYDVNSEDRLTFRFDIAYSTFKASGKVFMDGVEVDKANYETKEGSTIVIFTKAYTDTLKAGNHTIKVTTDEGEVTAEFTVKKSEKETNPPTADSAILYIVLAVMSIGAVTLLIKNRRKIFNY